VRVAIHEARHDDASAGVDLFGSARQREILQPPARAHLADQPIRDQYRAVLNDSKVAKIGPAPGTARPAQRKQLARAPDQRNFPQWSSALPGYTTARKTCPIPNYTAC
jgi:hypothetical protein